MQHVRLAMVGFVIRFLLVCGLLMHSTASATDAALGVNAVSGWGRKSLVMKFEHKELCDLGIALSYTPYVMPERKVVGIWSVLPLSITVEPLSEDWILFWLPEGAQVIGLSQDLLAFASTDDAWSARRYGRTVELRALGGPTLVVTDWQLRGILAQDQFWRVKNSSATTWRLESAGDDGAVEIEFANSGVPKSITGSKARWTFQYGRMGSMRTMSLNGKVRYEMLYSEDGLLHGISGAQQREFIWTRNDSNGPLEEPPEAAFILLSDNRVDPVILR